VSVGNDAACSAIRTHIEDLCTWLAIWDARHEPDAHARRCASDAIGAIDAAIAELHGVRTRLVDETRASDAAAERADALLGAALRSRLNRTPNVTDATRVADLSHRPSSEWLIRSYGSFAVGNGLWPGVLRTWPGRVLATSG
jgi:hypothetical protein